MWIPHFFISNVVRRKAGRCVFLWEWSWLRRWHTIDCLTISVCFLGHGHHKLKDISWHLIFDIQFNMLTFYDIFCDKTILFIMICHDCDSERNDKAVRNNATETSLTEFYVYFRSISAYLKYTDSHLVRPK